MTFDEEEALRLGTVRLLSILYKQRIMPFHGKKKFVLDRAPIEKFLDIVVPAIAPDSERSVNRCGTYV